MFIPIGMNCRHMILMLAKIKTSSRSGSMNETRLPCDIQTTDSTVRSHSEVSSISIRHSIR